MQIANSLSELKLWRAKGRRYFEFKSSTYVMTLYVARGRLIAYIHLIHSYVKGDFC